VYIEVYRHLWEERNLKKILVLLVSMALLVGMLSGCIETEKKKKTTISNNAPTATFNFDVVNMTVSFNSTAADEDDDNITYAWEFGDGNSSTLDDPIHTYAENGSYIVTLTVSDDEDSYTTAPQTIIVGNVAPEASFTYVKTNLSVNFTDASTDPNTGDTLTWSWDFGDGNTSTEQSLTYEYAAAGDYNVTLTATDDYGLTDEYTEEITVAA